MKILKDTACAEHLRLSYSQRTRKEARDKKIFNIEAFFALKRDGLEYGKIERRLFLHSTPKGEKLYIQYPGKESVVSAEEKKRPWDFRPKLDFYTNYPVTKDRAELKDLSFSDIWNDIYKINSRKENGLQSFAALLFRMAYMLEHEKVKGKYKYEDINMLTGEIIDSGYIELEWHKPYIQPELLNFFNGISTSKWTSGNVSFEIYLMYLDLLCQNEDCKYYFRDEKLDGKRWSGSAGRETTMKTHINILGLALGLLPFSKAIAKFTRGHGVASISLSEVELITNGLIVKG